MSAREDLVEKLLAASKAGSGLPVTRTLALRLPVKPGDGVAFSDITLDLTPRDLMKAAEQMALDALRIAELEGQLAPKVEPMWIMGNSAGVWHGRLGDFTGRVSVNFEGGTAGYTACIYDGTEAGFQAAPLLGKFARWNEAADACVAAAKAQRLQP